MVDPDTPGDEYLHAYVIIIRSNSWTQIKFLNNITWDFVKFLNQTVGNLNRNYKNLICSIVLQY